MRSSACSMRSRWVLGSMSSIMASRRQQAGPSAEHDPAAGLVVELYDAVRDHQGVVVRQRDDACAEPDVLGAFGNRGDKQLRRGDGFESRRVMLADPGLVVPEPVEPF